MYDYVTEELMKRVAWMYYEDDLNQQEIADRLKLSRTKVLRLLKDSRDSGFVRVTLDLRAGLIFALEKQICSLSGLSECFIVPGGNDVLGSVAKALAYRFALALRSSKTIGVGGGRTLHASVREIDIPDKIVTKEIIAMNGNAKPNLAIEPYDIASILTNRLSVEFFHIWAPARVESVEEAALIKDLPSIKAVLRKAEQVDTVFLSVGDMHNSSFIRYGFLDDGKLNAIRSAGAVGEVLGRFYDINGKSLDNDLNRHFISAAFPLKSHVIAAAGGVEKTEAIIGAVRSGWINGLITDEATAGVLAKQLVNKRRKISVPVASSGSYTEAR